MCVCVCQAKVTPGSMKRGKAGKAALDMVCKSIALTARERETAQAVKDNQLVAAMVADAKVMPSGSVAVNTSKRGGKK